MNCDDSAIEALAEKAHQALGGDHTLRSAVKDHLNRLYKDEVAESSEFKAIVAAEEQTWQASWADFSITEESQLSDPIVESAIPPYRNCLLALRSCFGPPGAVISMGFEIRGPSTNIDLTKKLPAMPDCVRQATDKVTKESAYD